MQVHDYLIVFGMFVSLVLAFSGFYNGVINRRFRNLEVWVDSHDKHFDSINARCMVEVGQLAAVRAQMETISDRLERLEDKLDRLIQMNGHGKDHA